MFKVVGEFQRKRLHQSHAECLAGIYERVDKSCKRRTKYLSCSFVIVQASFIWEKSAYLAEVSVMKQILRKFPNSNKSWGN